MVFTTNPQNRAKILRFWTCPNLDAIMCVLVGNTEGLNVFLTFVMFFAKIGIIKGKYKRKAEPLMFVKVFMFEHEEFVEFADEFVEVWISHTSFE